MKLRDNQALCDEVRRLVHAAHYGDAGISNTAAEILDAVDRALTATGPGSGAAWVEFPGDGQLPAERCDVLVAIAPGEGGHQAATAVGFLRHGSRGPFWVVTGMGRPFTVTHWCDCLGDGWRSPAWPNSAGQHGRGPVAAPQTDHRAAPVARFPCYCGTPSTAHDVACPSHPDSDERKAATHPSGSPPGAAELPPRCPDCDRERCTCGGSRGTR